MPNPERPHILLITTDQQRADALGLNGNRFVETPNLDALAAGGVNFSRAYVTCPVCIPARRTLLSGLSPDTHGMRHYHESQEFDPPHTIPGCLRAAGYQTQLIGKLHLHPQGKRYGYDNLILSDGPHWRPRSQTQKRNDYVTWLRERGVQAHPFSHGLSTNSRLSRPWGMDEHLHHNYWLAEEAIRFLNETRDPTCPVFLHLSFTHPHPPFAPVAHYFDRYLAKDLPPANLGEWCPSFRGEVRAPDAAAGPFDPEVIRRATAAYYALITHIDDMIAAVLDQWRGYMSPDSGAPVYVLFSSDHGEMRGDHQLFRKSLGYEASARVPFFLGGFNVPQPALATDHLVCWEDIAPTVLDLAGVEIPPTMEGMSLAPYLRGEFPASPRDHIFGQCGTPHNLWVVTRGWKYLWFPKTNEEQLFDLETDPGECRDVSAESPAIELLRDFLAQHVQDRADLVYDRSRLTPCGNRPPKAHWP